ncbi:hypothetical protein Taro_038732 [Colocasia esculenta]|uniref:Strictosidine synthase conserved region domain-containing protein n=1 Tax=Colocasia esculenta TaxID=4460 RepID=A0A843WPH1_COLES|nr:hypothetical protein [Colocasia esculenta]
MVVHGVTFRFTNGIDIDQETGTVYMEFILATIAGDKTGRLMRYDPTMGELRVLLDELSFPNGVALSRDDNFLLVVETIPCRVLRYWLRTPRAGTVEVLLQRAEEEFGFGYETGVILPAIC